MSTNYTDVRPETVKTLVEQVKKHHPDRTLILSRFTKMEVYAPTSKRKTHKFKFEIEIPEDVIIGEHAITEFGGFCLIDIATKRVAPNYLREEKD